MKFKTRKNLRFKKFFDTKIRIILCFSNKFELKKFKIVHDVGIRKIK